MTLFFVDTAHDPSEYVRAAWRMIADGGVWINMGPLLWHFHDMPGEVSIELTWQELRSLIVACVTPTYPQPGPPHAPRPSPRLSAPPAPPLQVRLCV